MNTKKDSEAFWTRTPGLIDGHFQARGNLVFCGDLYVFNTHTQSVSLYTSSINRYDEIGTARTKAEAQAVVETEERMKKLEKNI